MYAGHLDLTHPLVWTRGEKLVLRTDIVYAPAGFRGDLRMIRD